jgi:hypothetical protein
VIRAVDRISLRQIMHRRSRLERGLYYHSAMTQRRIAIELEETLAARLNAAAEQAVA